MEGLPRLHIKSDVMAEMLSDLIIYKRLHFYWLQTILKIWCRGQVNVFIYTESVCVFFGTNAKN